MCTKKLPTLLLGCCAALICSLGCLAKVDAQTSDTTQTPPKQSEGPEPSAGENAQQITPVQKEEQPRTDGQSDRADKAKVTRLPLTAGGVSSRAVFDSVAGDIHWIPGEVAAIIGSVSKFDTSPTLTREDLAELEQKFPNVFAIEADPSTRQEFLRIDHSELVANLSSAKSALRKMLADVDGVPLFEMRKIASTWKDEPPQRIVVCLAGLHGSAEGAEAVGKEINRLTNLPASVFVYPNDGPLADSARGLAKELDALHRENPQASLTIVTHSMGGLVARAAIESKQGNNTKFGVDQLIQVCPPNHGSAVAEYGPLLESVEQIAFLANRNANRESRGLLRMVKDGFNEAPADLRPQSEFLMQLNALPRSPQVAYTILAGDQGPLKPTVHRVLGEVWKLISDNVEEPVRLNRRVSSLLECDDLQRGKGDGVVSLKSARLAGVADFEVLPMHHLTWSQLNSKAGQRMVEEITSRLGISL
ncbi:MAG TPA: hypothetical protein DDW52_07715 [Planctomycetaceae bacterium]|nr:hypothetical protein [Planctomycetaceae bacterium]